MADAVGGKLYFLCVLGFLLGLFNPHDYGSILPGGDIDRKKQEPSSQKFVANRNPGRVFRVFVVL